MTATIRLGVVTLASLAMSPRMTLGLARTCVLIACGVLLPALEQSALAKGYPPDMVGSLAPIGLHGPNDTRFAYFWLDLRNRWAKPRALCGAPGLSFESVDPGIRPQRFFGVGGAGHFCGGLGSAVLLAPGAHLTIGIRLPVTTEERLRKLESIDVRTDALSPDGAVLPVEERLVAVSIPRKQLRRLPRLGDLAVISTSRAKAGASFGGWSASVRPAGEDSGGKSTNLAYWISLVNQRREPKALCRFLAVKARLLLANKELRTVEEGRPDRVVCPDDFGMDSGWRLVGPGQAFTFLFTIEPKAGEAPAERVEFVIQGTESSSDLEQPFSAFSIQAFVR
jgi:hypothetical protein